MPRLPDQNGSEKFPADVVRPTNSNSDEAIQASIPKFLRNRYIIATALLLAGAAGYVGFRGLRPRLNSITGHSLITNAIPSSNPAFTDPSNEAADFLLQKAGEGIANPATTALVKKPITQEDVDRAYDDLYTKLKDAANEANKKGRKLVVLGTGMPGNIEEKITLLNQLMLMNIASRHLGIKSGLLQLDDEKLRLFDQEELAKQLNGVNMPRLQDVSEKFAGISSLQPLLTALERKSHGVINNEGLLLPAGLEMGIKFHAGSPDEKKITDIYKANNGALGGAGEMEEMIEPGIENPMVAAIANNTGEGGSLGFYEWVHVPKLQESLTAKGLDVAVINCDQSFHPHPTTQLTSPLTAPSSDGTADTYTGRMHKIESSFTPALDGIGPQTAGDAFAMVLRADIHYQVNHNMISKTQAAAQLKQIDFMTEITAKMPLPPSRGNDR